MVTQKQKKWLLSHLYFISTHSFVKVQILLLLLSPPPRPFEASYATLDRLHSNTYETSPIIQATLLDVVKRRVKRCRFSWYLLCKTNNIIIKKKIHVIITLLFCPPSGFNSVRKKTEFLDKSSKALLSNRSEAPPPTDWPVFGSSKEVPIPMPSPRVERSSKFMLFSGGGG